MTEFTKLKMRLITCVLRHRNKQRLADLANVHLNTLRRLTSGKNLSIETFEAIEKAVLVEEKLNEINGERIKAAATRTN